MSRPIKFRCWDDGNTKDEWKWLDCSQSEMLDFHLRAPERFILEQFTGLLDREGKEIYEGDILMNSNTGIPYAVEFTPYWFHGEVEYGLIDGGVEHYFLVIGNVHETPHLLTDEKK